jgi:signal transduction histidine kinase
MDNVLEKIYTSSLNFLTPLSVEQTYQLIIKEALKLVKAEYGSIFVSDGDELKRVYASNEELYKVIPRKKGNTYTVYKKKKPAMFTSLQTDPIHSGHKEIGLRSDIMVPLTNQGKSMGVLSIMSSKDHHFTEGDLNLLKLLGPVASLAIRKAQLYDEIKNALETRDLFISMASHELRTPLTSINGYAQLLYSKRNGEDVISVQARWVEQLMYETVRLTNLVKELLSINQIKSGELQYIWKECNLPEIMYRAINNCTFIYPDRIFVVENNLNDEGTLIGDFDKLIQAITNIVQNAAKFSDSGSKITIKLSAKKRDYYLQVKDQGIGISNTDLPRIFEKFFRSKGHTREGMGLGMFLTNDIIRRHRGTVKISSKQSKGTTVQIKLPKANL